MTAWHEGPMVPFDLESTGVSTDTDRIVTACVAVIEPGRPPAIDNWLIDPGVEIPGAATAVHGITTEQARNDGQPAHIAVAEVADLLAAQWAMDRPVVGFNLVYDLTLLDRELRRHGRPPLEPGWCIDAYVLDKHVSYRKGPRKLVDQCAHYGVRIDRAHDAAADALAAARVAWKIGQQYPTVRALSLPELHEAQTRWAAQQAESFRAYLTKQGRTEDLPHGQWPMQAYRSVVAA